MTTDPPPAERSKPVALQLELPAPASEALAPLGEDRLSFAQLPRPGGATVRRWAVALGAVAGVAAVGVLAVAAVLPSLVRRRCIERAAAHGITLAIDRVGVTTHGFTLTGVKATATDIPGVRAEAPEVDVETSGLVPQTLRATGVELTLEGRYAALAAAFARWRASDQGGQGGAWAPAAVIVDGSRIVWRGPFGDDARIEASGTHLDVAWLDHDRREPTLHATSSDVKVTVPAGSVGPWRVDLDRAPGTARARIALDPDVPDASTLLIVGGDDGVTAVDASIPRAPLARLGIPPALLGLHGDVQLGAAVHYAPLGARATATAKGGLYGVAVNAIPRPVDVAFDLAASGDRRAGMDVKNARIALGPLVGFARGTLKAYPDGFRLDLAWHAPPVPCAAFDAALGPGEPFDIAYQIRKLAESAGIARVRGDVSADATLSFDSRDFGASTLGFVPKVGCDVDF